MVPTAAAEKEQESGVRHDDGPLTHRAGGRPALYVYGSFPAAPPKAMVAIVHGYGEYGERYRHVMDAWASRGIASMAVDLRGHGRAEGKRGFCERFTEYLDDISDFARLATERASGTPVFLFGHSFGGLAATCSSLRDAGAWRGLLLSAPYFGRALEVPRVKIFAGKVASRLVPGFALPTGFHGADVTRDVQRAREHDVDPLCFEIATSRWFTEAESAQTRALARASSLTLPLVLVMGTADRIARLETAREFFDAAGAKDKTLDVRPGFFHEVLNEPEWRPVAESLADWMLIRSELSTPGRAV